MKLRFLHGIVAGILAASASSFYSYVYQSTLGTDFSKVINTGSIFGSSIFGCMLIFLAYFGLTSFKKEHYKGVLNGIIILLSFASILGPLMINLPLDIASPELIVGLTVPMHFFPVLFYLGIEPFFVGRNNNV
jgi:hypothetical protein